MEHIIGNGNFDGRFDFYKWSAPFFDTPEEVVRYVDSLNLEGKVLKRINTIGCGDNPGKTRNGLLYRKITEAGIELSGEWWHTYPNLDKVMVPCSVSLCEPIQFIFDDASSFEILPTESGGARVGINSIPHDISDGLNRSDFNADNFFKQLHGMRFDSFSVSVTETRRHYINKYSCWEENTYVEHHHDYRFDISFGYPYSMTLFQSGGGWYDAELTQSSSDVNVPYSRVLSARKSTENDWVIISNGCGWGGSFWVWPTRLGEETQPYEWVMSCYGISIDESDIAKFLEPFLYKYFDSHIQIREDFESNDFDWYGNNLYSFDSVKMLLNEIRKVCFLLENDYDNAALNGIKSNFHPNLNKQKAASETTEADIIELRKQHVTVAIDFYSRFCERVENMMQIPGKNAISFYGP